MYSHFDSAVAIIINQENEILLQKKDSTYQWFPNKWCFIGGEIEKGETPIEALHREVREELGEKITLEGITTFKKYFFSDMSVSGQKREYSANVFIARFNGRISDIQIGEGNGIAFFPKEELNKYPIVDHDKRVLEEIYYL